MKTLVIDTATTACSVALFDGDELLAGEYANLGRGHAERLVPMIAALPDKEKADQIWVNIGPGSFTGIRVGISAARALALAWGVPCHGYGCLSLIAAMADSEGPIDVAIQGGHGEYFFQSFDADNIPAGEPQSLKPEDAVRLSNAAVIAGSAAEELVQNKGAGTAQKLLPDARQWPRLNDPAPFAPSALYIRSADAQLPKGKA